VFYLGSCSKDTSKALVAQQTVSRPPCVRADVRLGHRRQLAGSRAQRLQRSRDAHFPRFLIFLHVRLGRVLDHVQYRSLHPTRRVRVKYLLSMISNTVKAFCP
jgi:hypothetical protein